jgi:Ca-activated chloride channel family protein
MHFARPEYLNLLWGIPLLAVFFAWSVRNRRKALERLVSPALATSLTNEFSRRRAIARAVLELGFFALGVLALARPQWGARLETVRRHGVDVVVALDTSYSMNAEDVPPSRLEKAKSEVRSLIRRLKGDRIGLVVFSGAAVVQCPLTLDYGAANLFLDAVAAGMVPEPGTALAPAITTATSTFSSKERKYKVLVVVTDGEDLEGEVDTAARSAKEQGVVIFTVGVGTPEGRPIPVRDDRGDVVEYRKDPSGQVVLSRLDERTLARVALETGGRYYRATTSEGELEAIYDEVSRLEKKELESKLFQNFEDRFQYPLSIAVALLIARLAMGEKRRRTRIPLAARKFLRASVASDRPRKRRGSLDPMVSKTAFLAFLLLLSVPSARADSAAGRNKEGNRLFSEKSYEEAEKAYLEAQAKAPERPELQYNLGNALVKQKKYEPALQSLRNAISKGSRGLSASAWFNTGNALFETGKYGDAVSAYIESLRLNPADRDAKHNLELARRKLEEQRQKQQPQNQAQNKDQPQSKDQQPQQQKQDEQDRKSDAGSQKDKENPSPADATRTERRDESFSKERALQILDALRNQELAEQRKRAVERQRRKITGKDW